jgi:radical SAM protein with 4Fe4S-binding SPASM domain
MRVSVLEEKGAYAPSANAPERFAVADRVDYIGFVDEVGSGFVKGWCAVKDSLDIVVGVRVEIGGKERSRGLAGDFREDLLALGGSGRHAFHLSFAVDVDGDVAVFPIGSVNALQKSAIDGRSIKVIHGQPLLEIFVAEHDYISAVSVRIASIAKNAASMLSFRVSKLNDDGSFEEIIEISETAEALRCGDQFDIFFTPEPLSRGKSFFLTVSSGDAPLETAASITLQAAESTNWSNLDRVSGDTSLGRARMVCSIGYSPPISSTQTPAKIVYSPVTQCNLNCVHCISRPSRKSLHRFSDRVREEIIFWSRRNAIQYITTDYSGDIIWADERWPGEIDFLIGLDIPFHVNTNGTHLSTERIEKLLNSRLDTLNISIDAARPETYKRIRRGAPPLSEIFEKAADFARLRELRGARERVAFSLSFILMRSSLDELIDFIGIGAEIGADSIQCQQLAAYTPDMEAESLIFDKERFNKIRLEAIELAAGLGMKLGIPTPLEERPHRAGHRFCNEPWTTAVILGNGDVQVCCVPYTKIGNLNEESLDQIWNGDRYRRFRQRVNSNNPPVYCNSCPIFLRQENVYGHLPFRNMHEWVLPYELT